jgi:hypothetical protein
MLELDNYQPFEWLDVLLLYLKRPRGAIVNILIGTQKAQKKAAASGEAKVASYLRWAAMAICGLLVVSACVKLLQNTPRIADIGFFDETTYLKLGLTWSVVELKNYQNSGLYAFYYKVLSETIRDPVQLYFWGGTIIIFLCAVSVFVAIFAISESLFLSVISVSFFTTTQIPIIWPRVSFAAVFVISVWAVLSSFLKWRSRVSAAALCSFLLAFMRPEFCLAFVALFFIACCIIVQNGFALIRRQTIDRNDAIVSSSILGITVLLAIWWSFPIPITDERALMAFGQHYSQYAVGAEHLNANPWLEWQSILSREFPGARSVFSAARVNPTKFTAFVISNIYGLQELLTLYWTQFLLALGQGWKFALESALLILLSVSLLRRQHLTSNQAQSGLLNVFILAIMIAPVIIAIMTIHPREHYVIQMLIIAALITATLIRQFLPVDRFIDSLCALFSGIALFVVTPALPKVEQPKLDAIKELRKMHGITSIADIEGGWCIYLTPPCVPISLDPVFSEPFQKFLSDASPQVLIITPEMPSLQHLADDPTFRAVLHNGQTMRFGNGDELIALKPLTTLPDRSSGN